MDISEEQRKEAIVNARRAKQGKNKGMQIYDIMLAETLHVSFLLSFILISDFVYLCLNFQPLVTLVLSHHTTKTFTHYTSATSLFQPACLSSRSFHWPSPQSENRITCCTASPAMPFSGNKAVAPPPSPTPCANSEHVEPSWRLKEHFIFFVCFPACECTVEFCYCASCLFIVFVFCHMLCLDFGEGHI